MRIPRGLHEVFGESQTLAELLAILLAGGGVATLLFWAFPADDPISSGCSAQP